MESSHQNHMHNLVLLKNLSSFGFHTLQVFLGSVCFTLLSGFTDSFYSLLEMQTIPTHLVSRDLLPSSACSTFSLSDTASL